jgi:hypothetical protein
MEAKTSKKIALWMDQSHAILLGYEQNEAHILEELPSPIQSHTREDGEGSDQTRFGAAPSDASNNEHKKHNVLSDQIKTYFQQLEKKLMDKDELLLLGPGVTKTQFSNFLKENKHHDELHITVENAEKMSSNQLVALVKEKFSATGKAHSTGSGDKYQHQLGTRTDATHQKDQGFGADKKEDKLTSASNSSSQKDNQVWGDKPQHKEGIVATSSDKKGDAPWAEKTQAKPGSTQAGTHAKDPNPSQGVGPQKPGLGTGTTQQKEQPTWGDKNQPKKWALIQGSAQKPPMAPRMTSEQEEE